MEIFPASTRPTVEECLRFAKEADILVGIIAWRYGWQPDGEEKSITEMEYDAAGERLMFLLDRDAVLKFPFLKPFNSPKNASKEVLSFSVIPDPAKSPI
jgi:hypothetical protein